MGPHIHAAFSWPAPVQTGAPSTSIAARDDGPDLVPPREVNPSARPSTALTHILVVTPVCLIGRGLEEILRKACPGCRVTVVVTDLSSCSLPEVDAQLVLVYVDRSAPISTIPARCAAASIPILLLYPDDDVEAALEALRCGFGGLFPITESAEMLVAAIHTLLAGNTFGPPSLLQHYLRQRTGA